MPKNIKNKIFLILRIVVTFLILYFIFSKIDFRVFSLTFSRIKIGYVILAFLIYGLHFLISTIKWKKLVDFFKVKLNFKFYLKFNFIGLFYATIMPGGLIVGDLIKGYKIFKASKKNRKIIMNSILMDRITGFLGLLVSIIFIYLIIRPAIFPYYPYMTAVSVILLLLIFVFLFFFKRASSYLLKIIKKRFPRLEKFSGKVFKAINTYSNNPGLLLFAVLVGISIYLVSTVCVYFVALAVGINVSFINLFIVNCLVNLAIIIAPITFSGLGIREGFFVYFLSFVGVAKEPALVLSLLISLIYLLLSLGGGFLEAIDVFYRNKSNKLKIG